MFRIVKINNALERVRISDPERAVRLPDLVPMLEQRKKEKKKKEKKLMRKGIFFRALSSFRIEKMCQFFIRPGRGRGVWEGVRGGEALIVQGIQNKQDSEKGQFLRQHCEMGCFNRKEPTDYGPFVDPLFKLRYPLPSWSQTPPWVSENAKICCFHRNSEHTA